MMSTTSINEMVNSTVNQALGTSYETTSNTDEEEDDDISNSDFEVSDYEVKKWNLSISNGYAKIDWTLYVYWDMTVTNDDLTVNWKLKVTGNLTVSNWDIINNWRIYVFGKKRITNWTNAWTPLKLWEDVNKYDAYLKADLTKEELTQVRNDIKDFYSKVAEIKKQLKAKWANWDINDILTEINTLKEDFFKEIATKIQEDDLKKFEEIKTKELTAIDNFLKWYKAKEVLSDKNKKIITTAIESISEDKRAEFINTVIGRVDTMLGNTNLKVKDKTVLLAIKKIFQSELEKLSDTDSEISLDEILKI